MTWLYQTDYHILNAIQALRCPVLDFLMPLITYFAEYGIGWILLALVLILIKKTRKPGLAAGIALILGLLAVNLIAKPLVFRVRPYDNEAFVSLRMYLRSDLLIPAWGDGSFPSGHAAASMEAAVAILLYNKKVGIPALVMAILVCFSRLYLYMHYPSDVLAGMLIGTALALLSALLVKLIYRKFGDRLAVLKED